MSETEQLSSVRRPGPTWHSQKATAQFDQTGRLAGNNNKSSCGVTGGRIATWPHRFIPNQTSPWVRSDRAAHVITSLFTFERAKVATSYSVLAKRHDPRPRPRAVPLSLLKYNPSRCHDLALLTESSLFSPDLDHRRHNSC